MFSCESERTLLIQIWLSVGPLGSHTYNHSQPQIRVAEDVYYVPLAQNEVAIDSFIVHGEHLYMFHFASGSQHSINGGLLGTLVKLPFLPDVMNQHFIFVVPKHLSKFSCPHSDGDFLQSCRSGVVRAEVLGASNSRSESKAEKGRVHHLYYR